MLTAEQLASRHTYIGGSDMAIILGLSSYKSPYQLFLEKTQILEPSFEMNQNQEWGSRLEHLIRIKFAESHGVDIQAPKGDKKDSPPSKRIKFVLSSIAHPLFDFMQCNLDGFIPSTNQVFEAKCSNSFLAKEWGDSDSDIIPLQYLIQVAHNTSCTNADGAKIAVLIGGFDYREFTYHRDLALESTLIDAAKDFWGLVKSKTPPTATRISDFKHMYPRHKEMLSVAVDDECSESYALMMEARQKKKEFTELENQYKLQIMQHMKTGEFLTDKEGKILATWKANKNGVRNFTIKE